MEAFFFFVFASRLLALQTAQRHLADGASLTADRATVEEALQR